MAESNKEVFIDIKATVNKELDAAIAKFKQLTAEIDRNRKAQQALTIARDEGLISEDAYLEESAKLTLQTKQLRAEQSKAVSQYKQASKAVSEESGSIEQQRAQLALLLKQWDKLSATEREAAENQGLKDTIDELTASLNEQEQATGRFQRNVGNYQSVWQASADKIQGWGDVVAKIFGSDSVVAKAARTVSDFAKRASETAEGINQAGEQVKGFAGATDNAANATERATEATEESARAARGMAGAAQGAATAETTAAAASRTLGASLKALGRQLLALLANPVVAIVAAVAVAVLALWEGVKKLTEAFKKNDAAMTALESLMASFKPILDVVNKAFAAIVDVLAKVIEGLSAFVQSVMRAIPFLRDFSAAEEDLVRATDNLEEAERNYTVNHAKRERDIAELTNKSNETQKYSLKQRQDYVKQAIALEKQDLEEQKTNAKEHLRLAKLRAKVDNDTSDDTADKIAQLQAAVYNAEKEYSEGTRRLSKRLDTFNKEESERQKKAAEERKKALEEREREINEAMQKEIEVIRQRYDAEVELYKDTAAASVATLNLRHEAEIEGIKKRLSEEKNLTAKAREELQRLLMLKEKAYNAAVLELTRQHVEQLQALQRSNDELQVSLMNEGTGKIAAQYEIRRRAAETAFAAATDAFNKELAALKTAFEEGKITQKQYTDEVATLNDAFFEQSVNRDLQLEQARKERERGLTAYYTEEFGKRMKTLSEGYDAELDALAGNEQAIADVLTSQRDEMQRLLADTQALTEEQAIAAFGSLDGWRAAVEQLGDAYADMAEKAATANAEVVEKTAAARVQMIDNIGSALSSGVALFDELAKKNADFAKVSEALSYANILSSTGQAIGSAIKGATEAAAAGGPAAPFLIAGYIASMVAAVTTGITQALSTHEKAKQAIAEAGYAEGGYVQGAGTATSDSIPARLSNGESVLTARATAAHYETLSRWNVEGGGRAFPNAATFNRFASGGVVGGGLTLQGVAEVVKQAVSELHPVVSVKEITRVQGKVLTKEISAARR